jgi:FkbM family methyltransferase
MSTDPVPPELQDGEVVVEAGAYEGAWTETVCKQFPGCKVHAFEPASRAYKVAKEKLALYPNVTLYNVALGKEEGTAILCDRNRDGANTFDWNPENEPSESVTVVDTAEMLEPLGEIAVVHLNAEGDEITILERMIEADLIERVRLVMTQWHPYDDDLHRRITEIVRVLSGSYRYERRGPWNCWIRI